MLAGLLVQVFQLPTALAYPLFSKLAQPGVSTVTLHAVRSWIVQQNVMQVCIAEALDAIGYDCVDHVCWSPGNCLG